MNKSVFLILTLVFLNSCGNKRNDYVTQELSKKEVTDSINAILISISDDWNLVNSKSNVSYKISIPEIEEIKIQHWTKINSNQPINELTISGLDFQYIDSINTMKGTGFEYQAKVIHRNKNFGLEISDGPLSEFIEIRELDRTSLRLANGQFFKRKK